MTALTAGLYDRRCPTCGASPGIACHPVSPTDRLPTGTHLARRPTPTRKPKP